MGTPATTPQQLLSFFALAEKLKSTLRHSWLSDGSRQESVAEHSWMMGLLALTIAPSMQVPLNMEKVLQMIIVHDLAEAITTDTPAWENPTNPLEKRAAEHEAMKKLLSPLDSDTQQRLLALWTEYEDRLSPEALFVKAMDTLDVVAQHNVAPLSTWDENDHRWQLSSVQDRFFTMDPLLQAIKNEMDRVAKEKAKGTPTQPSKK